MYKKQLLMIATTEQYMKFETNNSINRKVIKKHLQNSSISKQESL